MATETSDKPTLEERHLTAANTSDLTVHLARSGQADVILAAGMAASGNRLGHALLHLQSEWDRCDKPAKRTEAEILRRAAELADRKGRPDIRRATIEATVWHAGAMRARAASLSGRNLVLGLLGEWAALRGVDPDLLSPAIFHWLAPSCPACEGRGRVKIPDSPSLSNKLCRHCNGAGTWPRPLGAEAIHTHIKTCLGKVKGGMAHAMYG